MSAAGYSTTPLAKKLGIKEGCQALFVDVPTDYFQLFEAFPKIHEVELQMASSGSLDFIHLFSTTQLDFQAQSLTLKPLLKPSGMLWVSWPKKASTIESNLNRDLIRDYLLANGLVDVKVCAIDSDWSGLKFVYRLKDRS